jgi:nucleolar protein 6
MSKRKRSASEDNQVAPRKTRVVDGEDSRSDAQARAAARQAKSERRSKKKDDQTQSSKPAKPLPAVAESLKPDQQPVPDSDHFSSNNDFVSLDDATELTKARLDKKSKTPKEQSSKPAGNDDQKPQQHRFILFIGNLPFSATPTSITHHFRALEPFTVRCMTDKNTKKFKGTAFLEFPNYDKMKTCLKLYHHSLFDPDAHLHADTAEKDASSKGKESARSQSKKRDASIAEAAVQHPPKDTREQWQKPRTDKTRRINVELTAGGGGGKSTARRQKIQNKNAKLAEERERFAKKEAEDREKKRVEGEGRKGTGANADVGPGGADNGHIHPSRLRQMK